MENLGDHNKNNEKMLPVNLQYYNDNISVNFNTNNPSIERINQHVKYITDTIIQKYGFNGFESNIFRNGLTIIINKMEPCYESNFGLSNTYIIQGDIYPKCDVYINNNLIPNADFYFATLFHEIDHYAFHLKKLFVKNLSNARPNERQSIINTWARENDTDTYQFCTELMARIDTANELMVQGISRNEVWSYGPGNEHRTTGEEHYTDSINYAKKFLSFQIGLYNLLGNTFGFDRNKLKNKQLPEVADKHFQTIMNRLRNEIFNSTSIERCKSVIDKSYRKLQRSRCSRNTFCSLRK